MPPTFVSGPLRPGTFVGGKFALIRQIGFGGTGVVFEAEEPLIPRRVAIKLLHPNIGANADITNRVIREAHAATRINHPNIVTVYEIGKRQDGTYYLVQELLKGMSLRERLLERIRLPHEEAINVLLPIMGALVAAHDAGIIHRDIKPENIFLATTAGQLTPKLIDFGLAKVLHGNPFKSTEPGKQWGTIHYMAPERAGGERANALVDVWAIGIVLFELIHGACPFDAPTQFAILAKLAEGNVPRLDALRPEVPKALADVVERALQRDVKKRYPSMRLFLEDLLSVAEHRDPVVRIRHARSIPNTSEVEFISVDEETVEEPPISRAHLTGDDHAVFADTSPLPGLEASVAAAEEALRINALAEAVEEAERAVTTFNAGGRVYARMRCVQAVALRWLGAYAESERCGLDAMQYIVPGSVSWYAVLSNLAIAYGYQGKRDEIIALAKDESLAQLKDEISSARIGTLCCLVVTLLRIGEPDLAQTMFEEARSASDGDVGPLARAWLHVASAELAVLAGDPVEYLDNLEAAVAGFSEAGDIRNACLQRANIGNAYMQLGEYARAAEVLQDTFPVIEPMKLAFGVAARVNLGLALARLGDVDQALAAELWAIKECVKQGYKRFESIARIYLSEIQRRRGAIDKAEAELRAVIAIPERSSFHALAKAGLADLLLDEERVAEAFALAKEAMEILDELDGVEEGEALIRLAYVRTLDAMKRPRSADAHLAGAKQRLLIRAHRINDRDLRRSFLENIPENQRTLALAARLDDRTSPTRRPSESDPPISFRQPG